MVFVGLDFGTTFSSICSLNKTNSKVLNLNGSPYIPSILAVLDNNKIIVGEGARSVANYAKNYNIFYDLKRWVGVTKFSFEALKEKLKPNYVCSFENDDCVILGEGPGTYKASVKTLICEYIRTLIHLYEETFNEKVEAINVSVPADYSSLKRKYMKSILTQLGVRLHRIINEPSAAALYSVFTQSSSNTYVIYDFGGGTFDCSIIQRKDSIVSIVDTKGDLFLGGRDIDRELNNLIHSKTNSYLDFSMLSLVKEEINNFNKETFTLLDINKKNITFSISMKEFQSIVLPFARRSEILLEDLIKINSLTNYLICMVGGSSLLQPVYNTIRKLAKNLKAELIRDDNLRLAVAFGCACLFELEKDINFTYIDVNSQPLYDLGVFHIPEIIVRKPMPVPYTHIVKHSNNTIFSTGVCVLEGNDPWFMNADPLIQTSMSTDLVSKQGEGYEIHYNYSLDGEITVTVHSLDNKVIKELDNSVAQNFTFKELHLDRIQFGNIEEVIALVDILRSFPNHQEFKNLDLDFPNIVVNYVNNIGGIKKLDELVRNIL